jgi:hypothetical protein
MRTRGEMKRRSSRARGILSALVLMSFLLGQSLVHATAANGREASNLEVLGRLEEPSGTRYDKAYLISFDERKQKLLYLSNYAEIKLAEYDASSGVPRLTREEKIGDPSELQLDYASPYTIAVDRKRGLAFLKAINYFGTVLRVVDLKRFKVVGTWDLTSAAPGFFADGITYSPEDGRVYMVGAIQGEGHAQLASEVPSAGRAAAVVAIDIPKKSAGTPSLAWLKPIPECQMPLTTKAVGSLIARSASRPALYFACVRPDPFAGQSGLVRLLVDPKADQTTAQQVQPEFFPISGSYSVTPQGVVGAAVFDPASERFFINSVSPTTPGAWVFDGKLSSWVGFVAAPDRYNYYLGLNRSNGRFYIASSDGEGDGGYLQVVDGRATPIPQGDIYPGFGTVGFMMTDPARHRLFVQMELSKFKLGERQDRGFMVLKDNTPAPDRPKTVNYDSLTSDLPEGPKTTTSYSAGINGYGTRAVLVGGYGGALTVSGVPALDGQVRSGDRGATFARLPAVDLRSVGASASAHAMVPDANTAAEYEQVGQGQPWPWRAVSCLDGNGAAVSDEDSQNGGYSKVACDLSKETVAATSTFGEIEGPGASVARSSITATAHRDDKKGTITEVVAEAEGIQIPTPQGILSIAKVISYATTTAHGHKDTAATDWYRVVSGVEVVDANGESQSLGSCDSREKENPCRDLEAQINKLAPTKLRVSFPKPERQETPGGAFAGVQQNERDFLNSRTVNNQGAVFENEEGSRPVPALELNIYNDGQEKSRLVLQLAAIQANSIYTISPNNPEDPAPPPVDVPDAEAPPVDPASGGDLGGGTTGGISVSDIPPTGDAPSEDVPAPTEAVPVATTQAVDGVLAFLRRTPQEALLVALVWLTFAGAGWAIFRRHQLLKVLGGTSR